MSGKKGKSGVFISFEGGDGAGKSTQIKRLADAVRATGREVVLTREPGGSDGAEAIRKLLLEGAADRWSPMTEALMMYAARADHLERVILPALERGAVVISDRFSDSTMAYQGLAGALGEKRVGALQDLVVGSNDPDLTIILDLPVKDGLARAGARSGNEQRFESKGTAFQENVRNAFLEIAKRNPERCAVIDATGDMDMVTARVLSEVKARLSLL
ncbi:dTMP kinase [Hyphococcus formosus]|uniref:dTMP kinase n=1 Tax=Hyphococcus formosus TaxID=3143534 RepID=UPI00398A7E8A